MAMNSPSFTSEAAARAMLGGLMEAVRASLRERIMERIQPDIDAAVEAGLAAFKVTLECMADPAQMHTVIRVLVEDRRQK